MIAILTIWGVSLIILGCIGIVGYFLTRNWEYTSNLTPTEEKEARDTVVIIAICAIIVGIVLIL